MTKKEIIENFKQLHDAEHKEAFLKANNIKFTYDSFGNLIIFTGNGVLELKPIRSR